MNNQHNDNLYGENHDSSADSNMKNQQNDKVYGENHDSSADSNMKNQQKDKVYGEIHDSSADSNMNNQHVDKVYGENHDEMVRLGFEMPASPPGSYNSPFPYPSDNPQEQAEYPPILPALLRPALLNYPLSGNDSETLRRPHNPTVNHLYIEPVTVPNVVALGATHRFRAKYVTVVYYRTVPQRTNTSSVP